MGSRLEEINRRLDGGEVDQMPTLMAQGIEGVVGYLRELDAVARCTDEDLAWCVQEIARKGKEIERQLTVIAAAHKCLERCERGDAMKILKAHLRGEGETDANPD